MGFVALYFLLRLGINTKRYNNMTKRIENAIKENEVFHIQELYPLVVNHAKLFYNDAIEKRLLINQTLPSVVKTDMVSYIQNTTVKYVDEYAKKIGMENYSFYLAQIPVIYRYIDLL